MRRVFQWMEKGLVFFIKTIEKYFEVPTARRRARYARYYKHKRVNGRIILYEAFGGRGLLDSPYALFVQLLDDPRQKKALHYWVLDDLAGHKQTIDAYKGRSNVRFVQHSSRAYLKALCKAKYLINSSTFPPYYTKKPGQMYINTWHGIPLKKMGYDMRQGYLSSGNVTRNLLQTDYLVSANSFTSQVFTEGYKLDALYEGVLIEEGSPRLDLLENTKREDVLAQLSQSGIRVNENQRLVVYAPTWRGNFARPDVNLERYKLLKQAFDDRLGDKGYQLLIKAHQAEYAHAKGAMAADYFVPATVDANALLSITDILISDFSSIYYDFLATGRPLYFYIPDKEAYEHSRGLYRSVDTLPGPVATTVEALLDNLAAPESLTPCRERYKVERAWCCDYDIGNIARRVIDIVFYQAKGGYRVRRVDTSGKRRILLFHDRMLVNGISHSLLSLLKQLDYAKYDVSLGVSMPQDSPERGLLDQIPEEVRILILQGDGNHTFWEDLIQSALTKLGIGGRKRWLYERVRTVLGRELRRLYGGARFDFIVDFGGLNPRLAMVHAQGAEGCVKSIWLHNDIRQETETRFPWMKALPSIYEAFDRIVSCGAYVMEVNLRNLGTPETAGRFTWAKNTINLARLAETDGTGIPTVSYQGKTYFVAGTESGKRLIPVSVEGHDEAPLRFITMGRLSPEKNQLALVRAFHAFCQTHENAMLLLLGDGPLREELMALVESLSLSDRVILVGNVSNPFPLMRFCDCFILPSLHEGQPMVLLEARSLGLPIIMSRFSSFQGAILEGGQLLIGTSEDSIRGGFEAFVRGEVPGAYAFDPQSYNREAYGEFLAAIGVEDDQRDRGRP